MNHNEDTWDRLLKIKTTGRDDSEADPYHYPYEPTPYTVLERMANSGYIGKRNVLIDYGCGKGRVDFFLSYQLRCKTIGVEYDKRLYEIGLRNKQAAVSGRTTEFVLANAENYEVPIEVDCFYFFNPFSIEILKHVMGRILVSYYQKVREMKLFFYYPSDEYVSYLMQVEELEFEDEISCKDLFDGKNPRERVLIFVTQKI